MFEKLLTRSALRVLLSVIVGLALGLKMPELATIACNVADILQVSVEACFK
jgi:hypothetical protein